MITLEIKFEGTSLASFCALVSVLPPAALAIFTATQVYTHMPFLVPMAVEAAFLALGAVSILLMIFYPSTLFFLSISLLCLFGSLVSGLCYLGFRLDTTRSAPFNPGLESRCETAQVLLWIVSMLVWTCSCCLSTSAVAWHRFQTHNTINSGHDATASQSSTLAVQEALRKIPSFNFQVSPNATIMRHHTFNIDERPAMNDNGMSRPSLISLVSQKRKSKNDLKQQAQHQDVMQPLAGLEAVPEGFNSMDWDQGSAATPDRFRWIQLAADAQQSREVSGSSGMSGSVYSCTNYNRRINDAGFIKDERVILVPKKLRHQESLSQYDLERLRLSS